MSLTSNTFFDFLSNFNPPPSYAPSYIFHMQLQYTSNHMDLTLNRNKLTTHELQRQYDELKQKNDKLKEQISQRINAKNNEDVVVNSMVVDSKVERAQSQLFKWRSR